MSAQRLSAMASPALQRSSLPRVSARAGRANSRDRRARDLRSEEPGRDRQKPGSSEALSSVHTAAVCRVHAR